MLLCAAGESGDGDDTIDRPGAVQQPLEVYHMTEPPLPTGDAVATSRQVTASHRLALVF